MKSTLDFAKELIARASVTPEDNGCQQLMTDKLAAAGFNVENMRYGDVDNFWAKHGTGSPVLCFAGHTDVVPPGPAEDWNTDPFEPVIKDGMLYGRGAGDMKAALAAMVDAAVDFVKANPDHPGTVAFLITSDEEGPAQDGTKAVIRELNERNPQIAARLLTPLTRWRNYPEAPAARMRDELEQLAALPALSRDVYEVVSKSLADVP